MPPNAQIAAARNNDRTVHRLRTLDAVDKFEEVKNQAGDAPLRPSNLKRAWTAMMGHFEKLEVAHVEYMFAKGFTPGTNAAEDDFLKEVRAKVVKHHEPPDPVDLEAQHRRQRAAAFAVKTVQQDLETRITALAAACGDLTNTPQPAVRIFITDTESLRTAITRDYIPATQDHLASLEQEAEEAQTDTYSTKVGAWRTSLTTAYTRLTLALVDPAPAGQQGGGVQQVPVVSVAVPVATAPQPRRTVAKLAPTTLEFSGRARDYHFFRESAKELLGNDLGPLMQYQYLWGSLPQAVKNECSSYTQDAQDLSVRPAPRTGRVRHGRHCGGHE